MQSESGTHKISDSGYSNSCSNSQSQRSGSSKSRNSGSNSSRSSGYCGGSRHQCVSTDSSNEVNPKPVLKRNKEKDHKKKKLKVDGITTTPAITENETDTDIPKCITVPDKILNENEDKKVEENIEPSHPTITEGVPDIPVSLKSPQLSTLAAESTEIEPNLQSWTATGSIMLPPDEQDSVKTVEIETEETVTPALPHSLEQLTPRKHIPKRLNESEDGFYCVISMHDGVVMYTTSSLTSILGFPQDMWLGRSFIDFVHPKDRVNFASHITTDVAIPIAETAGQIKECKKNSLYVSLRKYRGLKSCGFGVVEKAVTYMPFHVSLIFRQMQQNPSRMSRNVNSDDKGLYLIVSASPLCSPYKVPDETYVSTRFCTRHTTTCEISHVDSDVVTNFGFFPQDMLRHSIFEFYHPEDMLFLKKVYQTVIEKAQITGSVFRSKPYRFATQNGTYATIETDWSCFVNPWTRKVEFIVGHHRVIQGPHNPNIFESPREDSSQISEEVLKESKLIQAEIQYLLLSELPRPGSIARQQVSQRCKDLASFMETLMDDLTRSNYIQVDLPHEVDPSFSERDSVMLGEISPHHDYYDSKSSSETPPSYNQLNYNENLQRFFESKPMTKAEDASFVTKESVGTNSMEVDPKNNTNSPSCLNRKHLSPIQTSGDSGSGSADNSSGSNPNMDASGNTSGTNISNSGSYKPPTLTEQLLVRHNEDMEKEMAKRHRERRSGNKADRDNHKNNKNHHKLCLQSPLGKNDPQGLGHGLKRSGSNSWEGDYHKQSKHQHTDQVDFLNHSTEHNPEVASIIPSVLNSSIHRPSENNAVIPNESFVQSTINNANIWPPFSVSVTSLQDTNQATTTSAFTGSIMPVYYIVQAGQQIQPQEHPGPPPYSIPCLPSMVYPSMAFPTPMVYPSLALLHPLALPVKTPTSLQPIVPNVAGHSKTSMPVTTRTHEHRTICTTSGDNSKAHKPASQATSIKAEPGSAMGSIASNSVTNRAMSECSKRDLGVYSLCSIGSPHVSLPDQDGLEKTNTPIASQLDERGDNKLGAQSGSLECDGESSYSSFYSSFLKTEASVSNDDNVNSDNKGNNTSKDEERKIKKPQGLKRKTIPPWLEAVTVTPELVYQYQLSIKNMSDILKEDLLSLKEINQPMLVNDQLSQLYLDLELEGLSSKLTLEDGVTSSSGSSGEETMASKKKTTRKRRSYSKMVIIYEEDAPFPPPQ